MKVIIFGRSWTEDDDDEKKRIERIERISHKFPAPAIYVHY